MASILTQHDAGHHLPHHLTDMQPTTYTPVSMDETLQIQPYADQPCADVPVPESLRRSFFAMDGFLVSCIIPPLMGFSFVTLGLFIIYGRTTLVISHSTEHAAVISQAFTALSAFWHFLALLPALSVVQSVRSEEWWRRLLKKTSFNRANSVSSNIGGTFAHTVEIVVAWSSLYFKSAWIVALFVVVLADIAPGAIQVEVGSHAVPASFQVPALPPNSIYSNYSEPFLFTGDQYHASMDIAPIYYKANMFAGTYVKAAPPTPNALVPRPNISPGQGYRYLTDVAFMDYQCNWYAPILAEPNSITDITTSETLTITAGGVQGLGYIPLLANDVYPMMGYTDPATGKPSFEGNAAFVVTSGNPSLGSGYFNLSSVPTSTPSASWQAVAATWRANQTTPFEPVESMSVAVCSPKYFIEPWIVDLVNGSTKLVELQSQSVGNLDITQLNIAIQDCFKQLPSAPPIHLAYGLSIAQLTMLFTIPPNISLPGIPYPSENVTLSMNVAIPSSVQAYLDNFPFGNFTPSQSKLLVPALVLSAELNFVCAAAALYALLSATLLYSFWRPAARPFTIRSVLSATREEATHAYDVSRGQGVVSLIERIAISGNGMNDATAEARINKLIGNRYAMVREDQGTRHLALEIDSQSHRGIPSLLVERFENVRTHSSRIVWAFTPALGAALVGFGLAAWRHPHIVSHSPQNARATLFSALFTWGLGLWRSLSLVAVSTLVRQANSDEWSRLIRSHKQRGLNQKLQRIFNQLSTNTLSFPDAFRAARMNGTSIIFKICFFAALLTSLCAVVAQGAVTLLVLPSLTDQELNVPLIARNIPIEVPWSADAILAPFNAGLIESAQLGTSWTYLEQVVGASVADTMPPGYLVPLRARTNNTAGSQYPTDVAYIQCECSWVAPTLPPATANVTHIPVSLESFGITAIQTVPHGLASRSLMYQLYAAPHAYNLTAFAPLSNMTFSSNSSAVTSGLFAWTLWGGGPGDHVNLDSVATAILTAEWRAIIANQIPAYLQSFPADAPYMTNLTRATTLICDPRIQITPQLARDFGGMVELTSVPNQYSAGVGNVDKSYLSYMVYNYAVQQALDLVGIFRPYIFFGLATGNAVLTSDPSNPVGGTVPKSPLQIAHTLDTYIGSASKAWMVMDLAPTNTTVNGQIIQQSLIVAAALPQVVVVGALYLILGLIALLISRRTPGAPFTLAGILMMHSELTALHVLHDKSYQDDKKSEE